MDSSGRVALPSAFEDANIDNLALLIGNQPRRTLVGGYLISLPEADMLERLMAHNDQIPLLAYVPQRFF